MSKRALIIGITGQDGSYLAEFLLSKQYEVYGISRYLNAWQPRIEHIRTHIRILCADLLYESSLIEALEDSKPDEIYNLGGNSSMPGAWSRPTQNAEINTLGPLNLLEAIREICPETRLFHASSSEVFGGGKETPQNEETVFSPANPYGIAKIFAHEMVKLYRNAYKLFACSGILYSHDSPRRGFEFVSRKVTSSAAKIKKRLQNELLLGNMQAKRDRGFAGDYVKAMWAMLQSEKPVDYVIATGKSHSVEDLVRIAFEEVGLDYHEYVKEDVTQKWKTDVNDSLVGDASKIKIDLGWEPELSFEAMIKFMVKSEMNI